jgi:hypothetical protein
MLSTDTKDAGVRIPKWTRNKSETNSDTYENRHSLSLLLRLFVGVLILFQVACGQSSGGTSNTTLDTTEGPAEGGTAGGSDNGSIGTTDSNNGDGKGTEVEEETSDDTTIIVAIDGPPDVYKLITQGHCLEAVKGASALIESGDDAEVAEGYLVRALARACLGETEAAEADLLLAEEQRENLSVVSEERLERIEAEGLSKELEILGDSP